MQINSICKESKFSAIYRPRSVWEIARENEREKLDKIAYKNERILAGLPDAKIEDIPDSVKILSKCRPEIRKEALTQAISELEEKYGVNFPLVKALAIIKSELLRLENKVANHSHTDYHNMLIG